MELPPFKIMQILFQTYAETSLHHKTAIPPPAPTPPLVHNPQVTLWVGRHYSPITNSGLVQIYAQYHSAMHNGEKKRGGGGERKNGRQQQAK